MTTLLSLPEEILLHIISYLPKSDVLRLLLVCKSLNDFISNSSKALENVYIHLRDYKPDSFRIFGKKYSAIFFSLQVPEKILRNVAVVSNIGEQLRKISISTGTNFKLSYIQKMLINCNYLKKFSIDYRGMDHEICGDLPTTKINTLHVSNGTNVLKIFQKCKIKVFSVNLNQYNNMRYDKDNFEVFKELESFLKSQTNLEVLKIHECFQNLKPEIIPASVKHLVVYSQKPLQNYDFTSLIKAQKLERLTTRIYIDPGYFNQLSQIETLTHLTVTLIQGTVLIFSNVNVMANVKYLCIDFYSERQLLFVGKFPNLRHLKFTNLKESYPLVNLIRDTLLIIFGNLTIILTKIPSGLVDINFDTFELFIKPCNINEKSMLSVSITKVRYWMKEIELKMTIECNCQIIEMKMILKKAKYLSRNAVNRWPLNFGSISKKEILGKIFSYLDYRENLKLRLVCKNFNEIINESKDFIAKSQFKVNKDNFEIFLKRKFPSIVVKGVLNSPNVNNFLNRLKESGQNLTKISLHFGNELPLMLIRNLLNSTPNVKEIEIYESNEKFAIPKVKIDISKLPNLKLDSLFVKGNLRVLNVFQKSEIKKVKIQNPKNSFELSDFLSPERKLSELIISNKNLSENYQILGVLKDHYDMNFHLNISSEELAKLPLIDFIHFDFSMPKYLKKLSIKNFHDFSFISSETFIDQLCMTNCTIPIKKLRPCISKLTLNSCKITSNQFESTEENYRKLNDAKTKIVVEKLKSLNAMLEKVKATNIKMSAVWAEKLIE